MEQTEDIPSIPSPTKYLVGAINNIRVKKYATNNGNRFSCE